MKITINKPTEFEAVYLEVDAGVRYWDDGYINGMEDTDCEETEGIPQMPCAEYMGEQHMVLRGYNWRWRPLIDIETGQIVNWSQGTTARVHYKVCIIKCAMISFVIFLMGTKTLSPLMTDMYLRLCVRQMKDMATTSL